MSEEEVIRRFADEPITMKRLSADLRTLGLEPGMTVIVHTALSEIGWICGGAAALVLSLEDVLREFGTLVMPTHSGDLSDPSLWENPPVPESWWQQIRDEMPAFDPELTPTRGVGVVPEVFRHQSDVVRSNHPTVSFAAWGDSAIEIVSDHSLEYSLGEGSPLARLYDLGAWVLLIGAGFGSNTSFHLAEYRAEFPRKETVRCGSPVLVEGHRRWVSYEDFNYDAADFEALGADFAKHHKQDLAAGRVGYADALLFRQRTCVDYAVHWLPRHRL